MSVNETRTDLLLDRMLTERWPASLSFTALSRSTDRSCDTPRSAMVTAYRRFMRATPDVPGLDGTTATCRKSARTEAVRTKADIRRPSPEASILTPKATFIRVAVRTSIS
jgi:hypothetical protein